MRKQKLFLLSIALGLCLASPAFSQQKSEKPANPEKKNTQVARINEYLKQWSDYLKSAGQETTPIAAQMMDKSRDKKSSSDFKSLANQAETILKHYKSREQSLSASACTECQKIHNLTLDFYDTMISYFNALSDGEFGLNAQALLRKSQDLKNEIDGIVYALKVELREDNPSSKYYR